MYQWRQVAVIVLVLASTAPGLAQRPSDMPLIVEESLVEVDPAHEACAVRVRMRNMGRQAITAWHVGGRVHFADGRVIRVGHGSDVSENGRERFLHAGATAEARLRVSHPAEGHPDAGEASVAPEMVILEDATAFGDEKLIERQFELRERRRRVWQVFEHALASEGPPDEQPAETYRRIERAFESMLNGDLRNTGVYALCRQNLRLALDMSLDLDARPTIEFLREMAAIRRAAGDRHAVRR